MSSRLCAAESVSSSSISSDLPIPVQVAFPLLGGCPKLQHIQDSGSKGTSKVDVKCCHSPVRLPTFFLIFISLATASFSNQGRPDVHTY